MLGEAQQALPWPAGRVVKAARCCLQPVGSRQEAQVPVEQFSLVTSRVRP